MSDCTYREHLVKTLQLWMCIPSLPLLVCLLVLQTGLKTSHLVMRRRVQPHAAAVENNAVAATPKLRLGSFLMETLSV